MNSQVKRVLFEPTNACNLKCDMCPHSEGLVANQGFASLQLANKLLYDLDDFCLENDRPKICFHVTGEPFLNRNLLEMISIFSRKDYYTSLHTNGILIRNAEEVVGSGLCEIVFSYEFYDEKIYREYRKNDNFYDVEKTIKEFLKHDRIKVVIESLFFRHLSDSIRIDESLRRKFTGASFYACYASDWRGTMAFKEYLVEPVDKTKEPRVCPVPFENVTIGWEGKVKSCTFDYNSEYVLGDLTNQSLMEIYNGQKRKEFLGLISQKQYDNINICKFCKCPYYYDIKERSYQQKEKSC